MRKKGENSKVTIHCVCSVNSFIFNLDHNSRLVLLQHCVILIVLYRKSMGHPKEVSQSVGEP